MKKKHHSIIVSLMSVILLASACKKDSFDKHSNEKDKLAAELIGRDTLILTADHVFFSDDDVLRNTLVANEVTDDPYNQNKKSDYVKNWSRQNDTLVWPINVTSTGKLVLVPNLGVPNNQAGSTINISVGQEVKTLTLRSTGALTSFEEQDTVTFNLADTGQYLIQLAINKNLGGEGKSVANVKDLKLTGPAVNGLSPIRVRHRASAIHADYFSTENPDSIEWFIGESTIVTSGPAIYQPWDTGFGYYGSAWNVAEQMFSRPNFSFWSFNRSEVSPDPSKFSHLIGLRQGVVYGGFNHEGTGVKPEGGEDLYNNNKGFKTQVLALKKETGKPFNHYTSYFWDEQSKEWKYFSSGKNFNRDTEPRDISKGLGSFIEDPPVAGPNSARTGHITREVKRRGWFIDMKGEIYPINRMVGTGDLGPLSYKNWGITPDNQFFMQMGGLKNTPQFNGKREFIIPLSSLTERPEYLSKNKLKGLLKVPALIDSVTQVTNIIKNAATIKFKIQKIGNNPKVKIYWGLTDGLTFEDPTNPGAAGLVQWDSSKEITVAKKGENSVKLEGLIPKTKYYFRIQVKNDDGEMWIFNSGSFTTR